MALVRLHDLYFASLYALLQVVLVKGLEANKFCFGVKGLPELLDDQVIILQRVESFQHEVLSHFRQFMLL